MKTAMNIQMATQGTTGETTGQNENRSKIKAANMTTKHHIQSKTEMLAGLVVGGMMGVAFMPPGTASADESARPLGQVESSVFAPASTNHAIDMDIIEPSFYDEKLISNSVAHGDDMDLLDPGFYDAKLISASSMEKRWRRPLRERSSQTGPHRQQLRHEPDRPRLL